MAGDTLPSNRIPVWMALWILIEVLVLAMDSAFILLRPLSLPGGIYSYLFPHYAIYLDVDPRYSDMNNPLICAQSIMGCAEVVLGLFVLILNFGNAASTAALASLVSTLTMWKAVFCALMYSDLCGGAKEHAHNSPQTILLFIWIPAAIFILLPLFVVIGLFGRVSRGRVPVKGGSGSGEVESSDRSETKKKNK